MSTWDTIAVVFLAYLGWCLLLHMVRELGRAWRDQ